MFKPVSRDVIIKNEMAITLYKNRMCINSLLRDKLGIKDGGNAYVYYDETTERIGVSKVCSDSSIIPFHFDKRGYSPATEFVRTYNISIPKKSVPYLYEGKEGDIYAFRSPGRIDMQVKVDSSGVVERSYRGDKANRKR